MKYIRIVLSILALIVLVGVIAIVCLVTLVDPNKLKPVIAQEVLKETGYQLTINGSVSWAFFPRFGVQVEHMTLTAPKELEPFADLHQVSLAASLTQLLHGKEKLQGNIHIGNLRLFKITAQDAYVGLHWQNNVLMLQPITASLYDGTLEGTAQASNLATTPFWNWTIQLNRVELKPLLFDVNGPQSKLNINATSHIKIMANTSGTTREQLYRQLNGTGEFNLDNGVLEGIDFNYLVQTANDILNGRAISVPANIKQTDFQRLAGTFTIKNGIANTDNLTLNSSAFITKGTGTFDLLKQQLDYQLQITPVNEEKIHWAIPVSVTGDLHSPSVGIDKIALENIAATEQFKKVKEKVQDEIKKLPDKANQLIEKFMSR